MNLFVNVQRVDFVLPTSIPRKILVSVLDKTLNRMDHRETADIISDQTGARTRERERERERERLRARRTTREANNSAI